MNLVLVTYLCGDYGQMPVGLLMLAELARQRGWRVRVVDLPPVAGEQGFVDRMEAPDVVGFSTISGTFHRSLRLARAVKARFPRVTVVMGGPQATATARAAMAWVGEAVDMVFLGEAEAGWQAFLDGLPRERIPGILFRREGELVETPAAPLLMDLDALPMPAFDLYPPTVPGLSLPVETGRGCPFSCTYCSTNQYFSRRFRAKSPARILAEMDRLNDLHQVWSFDLIQDNFNTNTRTLLAFCDAIAAHPRHYDWNVSARPDRVDPVLARRLVASGCRMIYFGVETGSQRMQKVVRKNLKLHRAVANIRHAGEAGLATMVSFIVGFPGEEAADLRETLDLFTQLAAQRRHHLQLHLLSPLNGSHLLTREHHPLAFDGMPTDFNESEEGWEEEEIALFRDHPQLFPHMHHFAGTAIPRARYLFITHLVRLGWLHFRNFMELAACGRPAAWVEHLLSAPIPEELIGDRRFPFPHEPWIERGYRALRAFVDRDVPHDPVWRDVLLYDRACARQRLVAGEPPARVQLPRAHFSRGAAPRVDPALAEEWRDPAEFLVARNARGGVELTPVLHHGDLEGRLLDLCAACAECCLGEPELPGRFNDGASLAHFLDQLAKGARMQGAFLRRGVARNLGKSFLAKSVAGERTLHDSREAARRVAGEQGEVRSACAHLEAGDGGLVCGIQGEKPSECIAFPWTLVASPGVAEGWEATERETALAWRQDCDLLLEMASHPLFRDHYREWVAERLGGGENRRPGQGMPAGWDKRLRE